MVWETFVNVYLPVVLERLVELLNAPAVNPEMGWIVAPLVLTLVLMTFYFGKYTEEELGWNTAVGNSIVLLFVSIDLLRYLFHLTEPGSILNYQDEWVKALISLGVVAEGITLLLSSFFKALPKHFTFFICSPLPVNLQAYVAIAIVYTDIPFDLATLVAALLLFFILLVSVTLIKILEHVLLVKLEQTKEIELEEERRLLEEKKKKIIAEEKQLRKIKKRLKV